MPARCIERDWTQPYARDPDLVPVFKAVYDDPERWWDAYEMAEKLVDVEESFQLWRFRHMKTVERTIGHKTGNGRLVGRRLSAPRARPLILPRVDRRANVHRPCREIMTIALPKHRQLPQNWAREPLTEAFVRERIAPLFSRVLDAQRGRIYLANHSLGRPLDATADDVREGLAAWYAGWAMRGKTGPRKWRRTARASPRSLEHRVPIASCRRRARDRGCARCSIRTIACRAWLPRAASSIRST